MVMETGRMPSPAEASCRARALSMGNFFAENPSLAMRDKLRQPLTVTLLHPASLVICTTLHLEGIASAIEGIS